MNAFIQVGFKALLGFSILLLITRFIGKKQIGELTYITYISGISLGNMAASLVVHRNVKVTDAIIGLVCWSLLIILLEYISLKSAKARLIIDGQPTIVIKKGQIVEEALASLKINIEDLRVLLRNKSVFSLKDVDYAIFEPNGQLSILKNPEEESITRKDLQVPSTPRKYIPIEVIVDGKIISRNLEDFDLSREWLDCQLRLSGINSIEDVIYAELQSDGSLYVNKKHTKI